MADNKKYYYLKLKDNFFDSDEMIVLESMPDGYVYSNILLKLYLRSLKHEGRLMFNEKIPFNATMLAKVTRHSVGDIEKAIRIFQDLGLLEVLDNGAIYVSDIQNFIGTSSTEADRQREYRLRIKNEKESLLLNATNVISNDVTNVTKKHNECLDISTPEIELEIEREIELERDIKKPSKKKARPPKHKLGEFNNVLMTDEELNKLKEQFPDWQEKIDKLSLYIGSKGDKYKSHYMTILSWARKDAETNPKALKTNTRQSYGKTKPRNENHTRMLAMYFKKERQYNPSLTIEDYATKKNLSEQDVVEIKQLLAQQGGQ